MATATRGAPIPGPEIQMRKLGNKTKAMLKHFKLLYNIHTRIAGAGEVVVGADSNLPNYVITSTIIFLPIE